MRKSGFPIPPMLIAIDGFGCLLVVLGLLGLTGGVAGLPALSIPVVAWTLTILGGLTVIASLILMVAILMNRARQQR